MEPFSLVTALSSLFSSPQTWLALGSQLFGSLMQSQANDRVAAQQRQAREAEAARQAALDQQRNAAVQQAAAKFTPQAQQQQQQDLAGRLTTFLSPEQRTNQGADYLPSNPGAPKEIQDSLANRLSDALTKGKDYAKNLAGVSSFGRLGFDNSVALNRLGENVGQLNSNSANSSAVLPYELQNAQRAGAGYRTAADIANGVGNMLFLNQLTSGARTPRAPTTPNLQVGNLGSP